MTGWTVPGYTETSTLGSGATGRVVAAVEDATGVPVAIKYLSTRFLDDEAFLERFRAEAELLAGLEHPNVVRFHRYVEAAEEVEAVDGAEATVVIEPSDSAEASGDDEATEVLGGAEAEEPNPTDEPTEAIEAIAEDAEDTEDTEDTEEPSESATDSADTEPTELLAADAADSADVEPTELLAADVIDSGEPPRPVAGAALIMELLEGATLRRVLKTSGPISPVAALSVMRGSLLGLDAAHTLGIVHRDYKPANVLLTTEGVSKLADFGIAEKAGAEMPAIGTPSYMAPEQWEGAPAEPVTDIYAVTATFYECLTGHVPYSAETVFELEELHRTAPIPLADVPPAVRGLVAHGLAKDAGLRPADVRTFIAELEAAAVAEYGVEWEEEGRRDLAVFVWPLSSGSAGGGGTEAGGGGEPGPGSGGDFFDGMYGGPDGPEDFEDFEEDPGSTWKRVGRGTKAGLAAAAVAVIGSALAAVAFGSDGTAKAPVAGSTGITMAASSASLSETPTPTLGAGVNAATPGTPTPTTSSKTSTTKPTPTLRTRTTSSPSLVVLPPMTPSIVPSPTELTPSSDPTSSAPASPTSASSSAGYTIGARVAAIKGSYFGPCPAPSDALQFQVTFSVNGTLPNGYVPITYSWRNGRSATKPVTVEVKEGGASFTYTTGGQQSSTEGGVSVVWSSPGGYGGTAGPAGYSVTCEVIG